MENLIFSLNATVPIFLLMVLGFALRRLGVIDDIFASKMNKFVFLVPLPVLLFEDLSTVDFSQVWNMKFVLFCFSVTLISIALAAAVSFLWRDRSIRGEFIQAAYRSSAALLGIAFIQNIYGDAGMAPLMIIGSVPLYNVMAVVVLSFFRPERKKLDKEVWLATLKGIVTNPIILGIAAGLLWSALRLPMPSILEKTVSDIGATATPLGLMAMGASFDLKKAFGKAKPAAAAAVMKLAVFVPVDYRDKVSEALWAAGAGQMGNYDRCAYMVDGTGTYRPLDGASPAIGTVGRSHNEPETRVEVVFPAALCGGVVRAMLAAHPYEEPAFDLLKLENKVDAGLGVIGELEVPLPGKDYLESVKQSLGIGALPYAGDASRLVRKVALCGGAGAEFIPAAIAAGADVYMCGDLKYHDFTTYGDSILLANIGHYESEQCTKGIFYEIIRKKFPNFAAYYAEQEKNPISFL